MMPACGIDDHETIPAVAIRQHRATRCESYRPPQSLPH
jgi:hypothetical protein